MVTHPTEPDGYIVIFATGSYITIPDRTDTHVQSLYGIWDRLGPVLVTKDELVEQNEKKGFFARMGDSIDRGLKLNEMSKYAICVLIVLNVLLFIIKIFKKPSYMKEDE